LQIVRQGDRDKMAALIERLAREGRTRVEARRLTRKGETKRGRGRPRHFVFRFDPKGTDFSLHLQFRRPQVERAEIIRTLEEILEALRRQD
jgi:hypothetical protein